MKWNFEKTDRTDQQCEHCGLFYSSRGIHKHERFCPLQDRDERVVPPLDDGGSTRESGHSSDVEDEEGVEDTPLDDGVEDPVETTTPSNDTPVSPEAVSTDGGTGLGLEGPPEPDPPEPEDDIVDDGDQDECCSDPSRRALDPGTPIDLDDGTRVEADPGDELCDSCGALVEDDGRIRR